MTMFRGMIAAVSLALAATTMTASAGAQPGDRHNNHDNRGPQYGHGPDRGHGWNNGHGNNWRNHHRNCRTVWRHHHRVTRCR